jgi:GntR family transcriptional regulator
MSTRPTYPFEAIAAEIQGEIESGKYPPGATLPPRDVLMARFQVSKMTIGNAVDELTRRGLVSARRGHGTVVLDRRPDKIALMRYTVGADSGLGPWEAVCERQGVAGRMVVVSVGEGQADPRVAELLGLQPAARVIRRYRHALLDGRPVQLQTALYPAGLFTGTPFAQIEKISGGVHAALREAGWSPHSTDEATGARGASAGEAKELRIRAGAPVLEIERITRDRSGTPLELLRIVADPMRTELLTTGLPIPRGR